MVPVVIVPVLNRYDLLERCLQSIDYPVETLIIIDNGGQSTLHEYPWVIDRRYVKNYHVWSMPTNLGVAPSWNIGIKAVWLIAHANVSSVTEASGIVSTITKAANKVFYKYELVKNTGTLTETITASVENGTVFYAQELTVVLNKLQANTRNEILLLAKNTFKVMRSRYSVSLHNGKPKYYSTYH